jgi:starch synthase (maltosyl-transferring)
VDWFRPNAWPNTPDILTEQLQHGGRAAFVSRAILAATLSPSWGVYGPAFELLEHVAVREGSEEYLDSEKYQLRTWDLTDDASLAPLLTRLNHIRRDQRALRNLHTLHIHACDDPGILCFSKTDPGGEGRPVLVVVNLDPFERHEALVDIDLHALGLPYGADFDVVDELGGVTYRWSGNMNYVDLAPWSASAHVFSVRRLDEADDDAAISGLDDEAAAGPDDEVAA